MTLLQTASSGTAWGPFYVDANAAESFGRRLLVAHGLPEEDAATVSRCLVLADLRGVDTHGLQTSPHYLERVLRRLINPRPNLKVERVTPMAGSLDGQNAFGFVVAKGNGRGDRYAREFGVSIVSARRSTHFGMAANYALQAMDAGYIGIVFTKHRARCRPGAAEKGCLAPVRSRSQPLPANAV